MTIEEAIRRIKKHNEIHNRKERNAVYITEALNMTVKALEENAEMKRLLRLAVEDLSRIDEVCDDVNDVCGECPCGINILGTCKWKHADEAEKLIGGDENA